MINYDLHIHTEFCGHAAGMTIEGLVAYADKRKLDTIAITDHIFSHPGLCVLTAIRAELSKIDSKCKIIVGAEVDVDGDYTDGRLVTDSLDAIDYVVAGFHYIPTSGIYPMSPDDCTMKSEKFLELWRSSLLGIVSNPNIHTVAHPGRLAAQSLDLDTFFDELLIVFKEAAPIAASNNVAWEINELTGTRLNGYYQQQWYRIFEIALDAGVKLVYGSDAHCPQAVGVNKFTRSVLSKLPEGALSTPDQIIDVKTL